jgi:hypothetical protein
MGNTVSTVSAKSVFARSSLREAAIAALAKPKETAMPAAGKVLGGFTSQSEPIVLEISKKDKRVDLAGTALDMTCTSGDQFTTADALVRLPISKQGKVHMTLVIPPSSGSPTSITGGTDTFSGKLNRENATFSGVWQLHLTFSLSGGQTDQCDSGRVTFKARL